ncbi:histidinol-phosphate transaminase [Paenilisteria rocourtiae]|uniref:Histidinol-phosphate aminotransferase n=1 Tax=Listeria rocourtiae TaxID=647910 RepID=A0A4V3DQ95_9LIST|nr:histidinol-phosphate transaminase [Listeria rocourtiae]EUJ52368.1 histidinol-phosphate aminotransferase [Listeria rocourtiae FSL F6-920]MBC1434707.1 histidinol-phosphate transaminase [Listeria rocourtiae]MBC1603399.1 histidinol-phosphate transaminase [Listeria rocourtiae]TDR55316.1 histidinol phosphate aminotransferase [Listeria rocourtiae]
MKWKTTLNGLHSYKPGKREEQVMAELGLTEITKLSSNENPHGVSEKVTDYLKNVDMNVEIYPDGWASDLRAQLAIYHGVKEEELVLTSGVDELIALLSRTLLSPKTSTVMATPTFPQYRQNACIEGAEVREIALTKNGDHNLPEMLAAIDETTSIVWLCNPNNPTGNYIALDEIIHFLHQVPKDVLVVLDEAYIEYVEPQPKTHTALIYEFSNLIITRTFSKIYGLASSRVGYGIANAEIIGQINIVRPPFNTTTMGQKLAQIALVDQDFIAQCRAKNAAGRKQYELFAAQNEMVFVYPSQGNFVLVDIGQPADDVFRYLEKNGYIVRSGSALGFPTAVRITVGTESENATVIKLLQHLVK